MPDEINERVSEFIRVIQEVAKANEKDNIVDRIRDNEQIYLQEGFKSMPKKNSSLEAKGK